MNLPHLHPWPATFPEARALQESLARRVRLRPPRSAPRLIAGADVSYTRGDARFFAAVVLWDADARETVETATNVGESPFPYVPGYLSFRELPTLLDAFRRLGRTPDCVMFDGQGIAHPRRFGLACHGGMVLGLPSLGVAKTRLVGEHKAPGAKAGAWTPLVDKGETVGAALRTRKGVKPVFVSPGDRMDLETAIALTLRCCAGRRIPEPTRLAHIAVNALRREVQGA
ncbi:MAG: endonuclease V [Candidatus Methylomirabilis sp.]|nr:endonuclease V [Deltaproteobacteria bacterium]